MSVSTTAVITACELMSIQGHPESIHKYLSPLANFVKWAIGAQAAGSLRTCIVQLIRTRPTKTALFDAGYSAKRVTLSLALRSSGDACRGFERG